MSFHLFQCCSNFIDPDTICWSFFNSSRYSMIPLILFIHQLFHVFLPWIFNSFLVYNHFNHATGTILQLKWNGQQSNPQPLSCQLQCRTQVQHRNIPLGHTFRTAVLYSNANTGFIQTVKKLFSRTCKNQIPGFSRTNKTRFQGLSRINSVQKHGCIRSKKCTYQISYRCNCTTAAVFLKFKLTQKVTNCTQHFTMNFFSS